MRVFLNEVVFQCRNVLFAYEDLLAHWEVIKARSSSLEAVRAAADRAWYDLQGFTTAAAVLRRLLWGGQKAPARSDLRALVGVGDESLLRPEMKVRDHFEHVDQRVDDWWKSTRTQGQADRAIGPFESIGDAVSDSFRRFDPDRMELAFLNDRFHLRSIAAEVGRVLPLAIAAVERVNANEDPRT